jgi:hypothetical protein
LAIAAVPGGIGATHGGSNGKKLLTSLGPQNSQASFRLRCAQTDILQTAKLKNVIGALDWWRWMNHAGETVGRFFRVMYHHEAFA